jgi:hypothetical protein
MKFESFIFIEWILSRLLDYLDFIEIARMDSAFCNTLYRVIWLKLIAKDVGSVSNKVQRYITNNESIEWCLKRKVQFKCLKIPSNNDLMLTSSRKASLFVSMCCIDMVELKLKGSWERRESHYLWKNESMRRVVVLCAKHCSKLKKLHITGTHFDKDPIIRLICANPDLEEIEMRMCGFIDDECLIAMSTYCHSLHRCSFYHVNFITDKGIAALVSTNHDIEDIEISGCQWITDASLEAIAQNCHKLKSICIEASKSKRITDDAIKQLLSSISGVKEKRLQYSRSLYDMVVHVEYFNL